MIKFIRSYLLQHQSISIPGLGTIYVERIPAQSDFINRQLLPPSYHYRFDKYFDSPGKDFFSYLAVRKNVQDFEAIRLYNEWAQELRHDITAEKETMLEGVGKLRRDPSGEVVFEPLAKPQTYGVAVPAERIIRSNARHSMIVGDKETTTAEMSGYLQEVHKEKPSWWIYALIIAAVALTAIFFHYYTTGSITPFGNQQSVPTR